MLQKFKSRKFLAAVSGILSGIIICINGDTLSGTAAIISSIAIYCITEGYVDAKAVGNVIQVVGDVGDILESHESEDE